MYDFSHSMAIQFSSSQSFPIVLLLLAFHVQTFAIMFGHRYIRMLRVKNIGPKMIVTYDANRHPKESETAKHHEKHHLLLTLAQQFSHSLKCSFFYSRYFVVVVFFLPTVCRSVFHFRFEHHFVSDIIRHTNTHEHRV